MDLDRVYFPGKFLLVFLLPRELTIVYTWFMGRIVEHIENDS